MTMHTEPHHTSINNNLAHIPESTIECLPLLKEAQGFRSLMDNFPYYITRHALDSRYLYTNAKFQRIAQCDASYLIGKTPNEAFSNGKLINLEKNIIEVGKDGNDREIEILFSLHPHDLQHQTIRLVAERDQVGNIVSVLSIGTDITQSKLSEKNLSRSEWYFRSLAENAPDNIARWDTESRFLYINPVLEKSLGMRKEKVLGKNIQTLFPHGVLSEIEVAIQSVLESGEDTSVSTHFVLSEGKTHQYYDIRLTAERNVDNAIVSVLGIGRDVTEYFKITEALAASERKFRSLTENSPDIIARYDQDLRRIYVNPTLAKILDATADTLIGGMVGSEMPNRFPLIYSAKLKHVFETGENVIFEMDWESNQGELRTTDMRMTPDRDAKGNITSVLAVGRDITHLQEYQKHIHSLAFYDVLTKLPNRTFFNERINHALEASLDDRDHQLALMMIDLDHFKTINDSLGHAIGDTLLYTAAQRLKTCVRTSDTVARLGGDEFAVILPDINDACVLNNIAHKLLKAVIEPYRIEGRDLFISASIGIAICPKNGTDVSDLLKHADAALYLAKRKGRNNYQYYTEELTIHASERIALESDLYKCVADNKLEVYYQPQVALCTHEIVGAEALLRWRHPERGMIPPDQFIGIAEETGLIVAIGSMVLRHACETAVRWNSFSTAPRRIAVNLSSRQIQNEDILGVVHTILSETGCQPQWIELEITESMLLDNRDETRKILEALDQQGIHISIDDFGTGYSALNYINSYPIRTLKIDRSFINNITQKADSAGLVHAILAMAQSLNMTVVAEGIETNAQAEWLNIAGCAIGQGFFWSKAIPPNEFEALITEGVARPLPPSDYSLSGNQTR